MSRGRARLLPPGKLPAALLRELLGDQGDLPDEVLLPPALGEDACAIRVPGGALVAATDPITLTGTGVGAHAVVVNANDVAVMGARPRWFLVTLLLPEGTREDALHPLFEEMRQELSRLGATLVGGHTEVTSTVNRPVAVGQMLGLREDGEFVRTGGVGVGDVVLQVGPVPIEGAAVIAAAAANQLGGLPRRTARGARRALIEPGISVVEPALSAARLGASAMHDPTEGGLSTGLHELAEASGVALHGVEPKSVLWFEPGLAVCELVGADPWGTLASGCLLAAFASNRAAEAQRVLEAEGHRVMPIARAEVGNGVWLADGAPLPRFERDELSRVL